MIDALIDLARHPLPAGYRIDWDGEWHMTLTVFADLGRAMLVAFVLIYVLLVARFRSFRTPLVVLAAVPLARRIGLVNTMVFTHLPANVCLVLVPFAPSLGVAVALLLVRSALSQMDVPTRTSYVMAVVTPPERAAAASVTAVPRSLASAISPSLAGFLLASPFTGLPLVVCGTLKIVYDAALLFSFRHLKAPEEVRE